MLTIKRVLLETLDGSTVIASDQMGRRVMVKIPATRLVREGEELDPLKDDLDFVTPRPGQIGGNHG